MEEEYKVKELKRPKCQILMIDLLRTCGGWQMIRKRQESRMASRILGVVIVPTSEIENGEGEDV